MHSWSVIEGSSAEISPKHYSVWIFSILLKNDKTKHTTVKRVMIRCLVNKQSQDSNFIVSAVIKCMGISTSDVINQGYEEWMTWLEFMLCPALAFHLMYVV